MKDLNKLIRQVSLEYDIQINNFSIIKNDINHIVLILISNKLQLIVKNLNPTKYFLDNINFINDIGFDFYILENIDGRKYFNYSGYKFIVYKKIKGTILSKMNFVFNKKKLVNFLYKFHKTNIIGNKYKLNIYKKELLNLDILTIKLNSYIINFKYETLLKNYIQLIQNIKFEDKFITILHNNLSLENVLYGNDRKFHFIDLDTIDFGDYRIDIGSIFVYCISKQIPLNEFKSLLTLFEKKYKIIKEELYIFYKLYLYKKILNNLSEKNEKYFLQNITNEVKIYINIYNNGDYYFNTTL